MTEIKTTEQIMRCEFDILQNIHSQSECDDYIDEYGHKIKWVNLNSLNEELNKRIEHLRKWIKERGDINCNELKSAINALKELKRGLEI